MNDVISTLQGIVREWEAEGSIPEVDWKGRVRSLDFQEMIRARDEILKRIPSYKCTECPDFREHVGDYDPNRDRHH